MNKPPAFQFYVQDFLLGTAYFTAEETGGYIRLLCYQWDKGGVEDDESVLTIITGMKAKSLEKIKKKFKKCEDGLLRNDRLEIERLKQQAWRDKTSEAGKRSAEVRRNKRLTTVELPLENSSNYNPTLQPSSSDSNKLSREKVFELMRRVTDRNKITDRQIHDEVHEFIEKYKNQQVKSLAALVNTWAGNIIPAGKKGIYV